MEDAVRSHHHLEKTGNGGNLQRKKRCPPNPRTQQQSLIQRPLTSKLAFVASPLAEKGKYRTSRFDTKQPTSHVTHRSACIQSNHMEPRWGASNPHMWEAHTHTHTHTHTHITSTHLQGQPQAHTQIHAHTHTHTHTGRERERESERNRHTETNAQIQQERHRKGCIYTFTIRAPTCTSTRTLIHSRTLTILIS